MTKSKSSLHTIVHESLPVTDAVNKATLFNNFFHATFTRSDFQLPTVLPDTTDQLTEISIDSTEVFKVLTDLDSTKAAGCDSIGPRILKACATSICEPVTLLFNKCLQTSSIPNEWKTHKIYPVPKKGDLSNHTNYRPISLLCVLSKVLERIVYNKIIPFVHPQISPQQFGFLKGRSSITQMLSFFSEIFGADRLVMLFT